MKNAKISKLYSLIEICRKYGAFIREPSLMFEVDEVDEDNNSVFFTQIRADLVKENERKRNYNVFNTKLLRQNSVIGAVIPVLQ